MKFTPKPEGEREGGREGIGGVRESEREKAHQQCKIKQILQGVLQAGDKWSQRQTQTSQKEGNATGNDKYMGK